MYWLVGVFLISRIRVRYSFTVYPFTFPLKTIQVCNSSIYKMNSLSSNEYY